MQPRYIPKRGKVLWGILRAAVFVTLGLHHSTKASPTHDTNHFLHSLCVEKPKTIQNSVIMDHGVYQRRSSGRVRPLRLNLPYTGPPGGDQDSVEGPRQGTPRATLTPVNGDTFPSAVEGLSAGILIALFMLQKYGTSKVSFLFSPIMAAWTLSTPMIGVYSFCRYHPGVFKAISLHYIVSFFFLRNGKTGWHLLGGTVLVITGADCRS
ncbi:hypothetical protein J5N97_005665 [Dioscorea zingiberensis]|uniref:K+ potassium transporter integral membrane domain-containing protein n=1 Tax=Dioscorea zingiberensis TaxID=325984 RepID=A0A9D5DA70_9LILI|nr:hypothetical protein J5N97_005665 [Dioscorea zingiberensis]